MNLFLLFKQFLHDEHFKFQEHLGNEKYISAKINGEKGIINTTVHYVPEQKSLLCFSDFPFIVPKSNIGSAMRFLTLKNIQMLFTTFLVNERNGIIRLKTVLYSYESEINKETFRRFFYGNFSTMDASIPEITSVIFSNPSQAIDIKNNKINLN